MSSIENVSQCHEPTQELLGILKPDLVRRNLADVVLQEINNRLWFIPNFEVFHVKKVKLTQEQGEQLYEEHREKFFFNDQVKFITSNEIVVFLMRGDNIISIYRTILGATNPQNADPRSLRKQYGISIDENSFHASDSSDSAQREINLFKSFNVF